MSKETISHIFERFYRVDKSRRVEGNGLGLSIVKKSLQLLKYDISVNNVKNGVNFIIK